MPSLSQKTSNAHVYKVILGKHLFYDFRNLLRFSIQICLLFVSLVSSSDKKACKVDGDCTDKPYHLCEENVCEDFGMTSKFFTFTGQQCKTYRDCTGNAICLGGSCLGTNHARFHGGLSSERKAARDILDIKFQPLCLFFGCCFVGC
uniref:Uncharacterized protein n=1 Tax=Caenorhabditis japonica TaxID=281687 RepID=A0A8R1IS03_CAEJA